MRSLLACTCLTPIVLFAAGAPAFAETTIGDKKTTAVATSTVKNGARDDIRITSAGSVVPTGGVAVTIDSANSVKNEGTIQVTGANDSAGIQANAGTSGTITNSGKIMLDENFTPADDDKDGDNDGPFAQGARRFGIRTLGGFTGSIVNSGTISIEGNDSAGISLGGPLTGSVTSSGTVEVAGNNSVGIRTQDVTGDVKISGKVATAGAGSVGLAVDGNIGGALQIQNVIASTGYRSTTAPADTSKLDADDLLQGGPAVRVSGNVAKGITVSGAGSAASFGSAAGLQLGSATNALSIGAIAGNSAGHGILVDGTIAGNGVYKDVNGNGLVVGGLGRAVTVAGGMTVNGSISASSNNANATGARIGSGASMPVIRSAGTITATGGGAASSQIRAIAIDAGADVRTIVNSGTISANAGGDSSAIAIQDKAGTLTLIENSGSIGAASAKTGPDKAVAIDISANTSGATIKQTAVAADKTAPSIVGSILLGSGNDVVDIADGTVTGRAAFGAGNNRLALSGDGAFKGDVTFGAGSDTVALAGTSTLAGKLDFGGGSDSLTLGGTAKFSGALANSAGLAVALNGGNLDLTQTGTVALSSLSLTGQSTLGVTIGGEANAYTQYVVSGGASFGEGSKLNVTFDNVGEAEGQYVIVRAGTLTGGGNLTAAGVALPYLFKSSLSADQAAGEVVLDIDRKTATEMALSGSQSRAYDAVFEALDEDEDVADVFLGIEDGEAFRTALQQMLPDHAGGVFETVTQGSRATARFLADPDPAVSDQGRWGFSLQQVAWGTSKDRGDTAGYETSGWGASGGFEFDTGEVGHAGLTLAYLGGKNGDDDLPNEINADQYELAAYWRGGWGGLRGHARISAAEIGFSGTRQFAGEDNGQAVIRKAEGDWDGRLFSASGGLSYELRAGRLSFRPAVLVDYYHLKEDGYAEEGGGDAFNLIVDSRTSDELAGTATLTAGIDLLGLDPSSTWIRAEIEGGRREILGGKLGDTVARFADGEDFTLVAEERDSGWVGKVRLIGGNSDFRVGGELNVEERHENAAVAFRASLTAGF
jgi:hypothetical protein